VHLDICVLEPSTETSKSEAEPCILVVQFSCPKIRHLRWPHVCKTSLQGWLMWATWDLRIFLEQLAVAALGHLKRH